MDDFQPQGGDSLHEPGKGCGIRKLGAEGRCTLADGDVAVVEFCAQHGTRLPSESDFINLRSHQGYTPSI